MKKHYHIRKYSILWFLLRIFTTAFLLAGAYSWILILYGLQEAIN